jgi:hypothetical protein
MICQNVLLPPNSFVKKEAAGSIFLTNYRWKTTENFGSVLMAKGVTYKCSVIIKLTHIGYSPIISKCSVYYMLLFNITPLLQTFSFSSLIKVSAITYILCVLYKNKELFRPSSADRHRTSTTESCFASASIVCVHLLCHCPQRQRCRIHFRGVGVKWETDWEWQFQDVTGNSHDLF